MRAQYIEKNNQPLSLGVTAQNLSISPTIAIDELVSKKNQNEMIHMRFRESSFPLHPLLKKALADAASYTRYGPVRGLAELRETIAEYLNRTREIKCSADQIIIGPGSKALIIWSAEHLISRVRLRYSAIVS